MVDHFKCLNSDIEEFSVLGSIIICGDLNSRTGLQEDRININWGSLTDVVESIDCVADLDQKVPMRKSCDTVVNPMGKHLIKLCKDNNLTILNGRLPGDSHPTHGGSITFQARGQKGKSLIDYFIASPEIVFGNNGVAFDGNSLKVTFPICVQEMTDHGCVALRIHIPKAIKPEQNNSGSILKYKYRPEVMETFTDILSSEGMKEKLACVGNDNLDAVESYALFNEVMSETLHEVHARHGRVIANNSQTSVHKNITTNSWYNDECRFLRKNGKTLKLNVVLMIMLRK
jgi:hypothetical protein